MNSQRLRSGQAAVVKASGRGRRRSDRLSASAGLCLDGGVEACLHQGNAPPKTSLTKVETATRNNRTNDRPARKFQGSRSSSLAFQLAVDRISFHANLIHSDNPAKRPALIKHLHFLPSFTLQPNSTTFQLTTTISRTFSSLKS